MSDKFNYFVEKNQTLIKALIIFTLFTLVCTIFIVGHTFDKEAINVFRIPLLIVVFLAIPIARVIVDKYKSSILKFFGLTWFIILIMIMELIFSQ